MAAATRLAPHSGSASRFEANVATRDAGWVRFAVLAAGLTFFAVFLLLPLGAVFVEALRKGFGVYVAALVEPDAVSAIRPTLLAAAIAVPLNPCLSRGNRRWQLALNYPAGRPKVR